MTTQSKRTVRRDPRKQRALALLRRKVFGHRLTELLLTAALVGGGGWGALYAWNNGGLDPLLSATGNLFSALGGAPEDALDAMAAMYDVGSVPSLLVMGARFLYDRLVAARASRKLAKVAYELLRRDDPRWALVATRYLRG